MYVYIARVPDDTQLEQASEEANGAYISIIRTLRRSLCRKNQLLDWTHVAWQNIQRLTSMLSRAALHIGSTSNPTIVSFGSAQHRWTQRLT